MTIASRPSVGRDGCRYRFDLGLRKTRIFLRRGLDMQVTGESLICPSGNQWSGRTCSLVLHSGVSGLLPQGGRISAGTDRLQTSFLVVSVFRSRLLNFGWSMSACDPLAGSNHTLRHDRKVQKPEVAALIQSRRLHVPAERSSASPEVSGMRSHLTFAASACDPKGKL